MAKVEKVTHVIFNEVPCLDKGKTRYCLYSKLISSHGMYKNYTPEQFKHWCTKHNIVAVFEESEMPVPSQL